MAMLPGTFTRYDAVGVREQLAAPVWLVRPGPVATVQSVKRQAEDDTDRLAEDGTPRQTEGI